jgi:hypothetical protein
MTAKTKKWKDIALIEQPRGRDSLDVHVQYPSSWSGSKEDHIGIINCEDGIEIAVESIPALIEALLKAQQHIEDRKS